MERYDDVEMYPESVRPIIGILLKYETKLSDAFGWYAPEGDTKALLIQMTTEMKWTIRNEGDRQWLFDLATDLENADRLGDEVDEPEGVRYVQLSDTVVRMIVGRLLEIVDFE